MIYKRLKACCIMHDVKTFPFPGRQRKMLPTILKQFQITALYNISVHIVNNLPSLFSVKPLSGFIIHSVFHVLRILACNIKVSPGTQAVKHGELHCCCRLWQLIRNSREIFYISALPPLFACGSHVYTLLRISACYTWLYVSLSLSSPFFSLCVLMHLRTCATASSEVGVKELTGTVKCARERGSR